MREGVEEPREGREGEGGRGRWFITSRESRSDAKGWGEEGEGKRGEQDVEERGSGGRGS